MFCSICRFLKENVSYYCVCRRALCPGGERDRSAMQFFFLLTEKEEVSKECKMALKAHLCSYYYSSKGISYGLSVKSSDTECGVLIIFKAADDS